MAEVRSRLNSLEIRVNAQQAVRFNLLLGATVAVMITMWVTTILVIVLRL